MSDRDSRVGCLIIIILIAIIAVIWGNISSCQEQEEAKRQTSIINEVRPLIETCKSIKISGSILLQGKALVWDMSSNSRSGAYNFLSEDLRARSSEKQITVFMVIGSSNETVGTYTISHQPGYRQYVDVCVAYWPDRKAAGQYSVISKEPPDSRVVKKVPEYGDPNEPIAKWIQSLRRNP